MPKEGSPGRPTTRQYSPREKSDAARLPDQAKTSGPGRRWQQRETSQTKGTPGSGQCSRGSLRAASTSLLIRPSRANSTLTVFSLLPRCQRAPGSQK